MPVVYYPPDQNAHLSSAMKASNRRCCKPGDGPGNFFHGVDHKCQGANCRNGAEEFKTLAASVATLFQSKCNGFMGAKHQEDNDAKSPRNKKMGADTKNAMLTKNAKKEKE